MTESGKEVDIKNCDMSKEMKQKAIEIAKQALEKYVIVTHCNLSYIAKNIDLGINVKAMQRSSISYLHC